MLCIRKTIAYPRYNNLARKWMWGCGKCKRWIIHPIYKFCPFCGRKIVKYEENNNKTIK